MLFLATKPLLEFYLESQVVPLETGISTQIQASNSVLCTCTLSKRIVCCEISSLSHSKASLLCLNSQHHLSPITFQQLSIYPKSSFVSNFNSPPNSFLKRIFAIASSTNLRISPPHALQRYLIFNNYVYLFKSLFCK